MLAATAKVDGCVVLNAGSGQGNEPARAVPTALRARPPWRRAGVRAGARGEPGDAAAGIGFGGEGAPWLRGNDDAGGRPAAAGGVAFGRHRGASGDTGHDPHHATIGQPGRG